MNPQHADPRDAALFAALPHVLVPRYGKLEEIEPGRSRLLLARDGLYLEARTNVLHTRVLAAAMPGLPYGPIEPLLIAPQIEEARELIAECPDRAKKSLPNEWAGLIVRVEGRMQLIEPETLGSGPAHIRYRSTGIDPLDILVDLHSHGRMGAFFSQTDDADDLVSPAPTSIALVFGRLEAETPEYVTRGLILGRCFALEDLKGIRHLGLEPDRDAAREP